MKGRERGSVYVKKPLSECCLSRYGLGQEGGLRKEEWRKMGLYKRGVFSRSMRASGGNFTAARAAIHSRT